MSLAGGGYGVDGWMLVVQSLVGSLGQMHIYESRAETSGVSRVHVGSTRACSTVPKKV